MKIGIVVPFSWSYWGGVVEHAENQAAALRARGHEVKIVMGHDPPGALTRLLHPALGRHGDLPAEVIPVGRSVVVPANGSLPNIVLSPRAIARVREVLARRALRRRPPARADDAGDLRRRRSRSRSARSSRPGTPSGELALDAAARCRLGLPRSTGSTRASPSRAWRPSRRARWLGGEFEVIPNGVVVPEHADAGGPRAPRSSSSAATTRARGCRCCCGPGRRSAAAPARGCG